MKRMLGILLAVAMLVSVMPMVAFADALPEELAEYQVGKVYHDVNFDDGTLTGTNGATLSPYMPTGASGSFANGAYTITNAGSTQAYLAMGSRQSDGAGVYVWEFTATLNGSNGKLDTLRKLAVDYNGSTGNNLIYWDWGNTYASIQLFNRSVNTGKKVNPGEAHDYKMIVDTVNGKAWFYLDGELASEVTDKLNADSYIGNSYLYPGFQKSGDSTSGAIDTFDNVKMYSLIVPSFNGITRDDTYGDVPAGTKVSFTVDAKLGEGSTMSYYVNGERKGAVTDNKFTIEVAGGVNTVYAQVDGSNIKSPEVTVTGIAYQVGKTYIDSTNVSIPVSIATAENDGAGVYMWEMKATLDATDHQLDTNRLLRAQYKHTGSANWEETDLIKWDAGWPKGSSKYAKVQVAKKTVTGLEIYAGEEHTYKVIVDTKEGLVWFYLDGELVYRNAEVIEKDKTVGTSTFKIIDSADDLNDSIAYIKMQKLIVPQFNGITRDDSYGEVPAGSKVSFTLDAELGADTVVGYYVNGVRQGTVVDNKFTVEVLGGINEVYAQVDGTDIKSDTVVVQATNYEIDKVYHDVNFDNESLKGEQGVALTSNVSNDNASYITESGADKAYQISLSAAKSSEINLAELKNEGDGVYVFEITASFDNPTAAKRFNATRYLRATIGGTQNKEIFKWDGGWGNYAPLYALGERVTGISINVGEDHTYKAILDTKNGVSWFYLDGVLMKKSTTFVATGAAITNARYAFGNTAGTLDVIDDVKLYKVSDAGVNNRYLYTSGGVAVDSISEITDGLQINAAIYNKSLAEGKVALLTAIKKNSDNSLAAVNFSPITFTNGQSSQIVNVSFDTLPTDIATGGYTVYHYLWGWDEDNMLTPLATEAEGLK